MLWSSLSLKYIELSLPLGPLLWGVSLLDFGPLLYPFVNCSLLAWFSTIQALPWFSWTMVDLGSFLFGFHFLFFVFFVVGAQGF